VPFDLCEQPYIYTPARPSPWLRGCCGGGRLSGFCCARIYTYRTPSPHPRTPRSDNTPPQPLQWYRRLLVPAAAATAARLKGSGKRPGRGPLGGLSRRDKKLISMTAVKNTPDRRRRCLHLPAAVYTLYFLSPRLSLARCLALSLSSALTHTYTRIYISRVSR